jgi:Ca-activated chloride channel family protein
MDLGATRVTILIMLFPSRRTVHFDAGSGGMMAGRHQIQARAPRARRPGFITALVLVVVAAVAVGVTALVVRSRPSSPPSAAASTGPCTAAVSLSVVAAPSISSVLNDVATHWTAGRPAVDGACITVSVHSTSSASEEPALAKPDVTLPDVWIPDSTQWVQRLRTDTSGVDSPVQSAWLYPAIATSPLVLATTPGQAKALGAVAAAGWPSVLSDSAAVSMVDPMTSTDGLLALLTTESLVDRGAATPSRKLVSTLVGMSKSVLASPQAGFLALSQRRAPAHAFPASEQEVVAANAGSGASGNPSTVAVYPTGRAVSFDFPVVQFAPPGGDPAQRDAAVAFVAHLSQSYAKQQLRAAGMRDPAGNPLAGAAPVLGVTATEVANMTVPPPERVSDGLRVWTAAGRGNRALAVIDLSGSMAETVGGGQPKINFAAQAEQAAVDFFPDTSSLGLWGFATDLTPTTDWLSLVALGPLGQAGRRHALTVAARSLPSRTRGNTGLYKTTLAAFEAVRTGYDPALINSVVLLTDGANTDTSGIDLPTLLSRLRSETNPARPLPIITIAIGSDADVATLKKISAATGGTEYTVDEPGDIHAAFLDAIIKTG